MKSVLERCIVADARGSCDADTAGRTVQGGSEAHGPRDPQICGKQIPLYSSARLSTSESASTQSEVEELQRGIVFINRFIGAKLSVTATDRP
ncbi:hypothetical protein NDU88_001276 [Pleurodeles waltl]|uniref:Uncharacterized protein n=1 Tax=Pleurodeles waltl TaxID=8319 RepID=A0AAV7KSG8_PLEWA|nr:hypothetical protein NDU88_001276 [Pleurodeles waltl]